MDAEMVSAKYYSPMRNDKEMGESWLALKREMEIQRFARRVGLPRDQVALIANVRTGKAFPQWIYAAGRPLPEGCALKEKEK